MTDTLPPILTKDRSLPQDENNQSDLVCKPFCLDKKENWPVFTGTAHKIASIGAAKTQILFGRRKNKLNFCDTSHDSLIIKLQFIQNSIKVWIFSEVLLMKSIF